MLLRLLINKHDRKNAEQLLSRANAGEFELMTSMFALYEAVACIEETDTFDTKMLMRILRDITIETQFEKDLGIMYKNFTEKRKAKLRDVALAQWLEDGR